MDSQSILNQLNAFRTGRRKPQDILAESQNRLGVTTSRDRLTGLRGALSNTENLIKAVEPGVSGRTSGSLVNEGQRNRLVQMERAPLDETFRNQQGALSDENATYSNLNQNALTEAQLAIADDDSQLNSLQGLYQTLYQREQDAKAERERAAATAQQQAYLNSLMNPVTPGTTGDTQINNKPKQVYKDSKGQIIGYEGGRGLSRLTDTGKMQEDRFWASRGQKNFLQKWLSGAGNYGNTLVNTSVPGLLTSGIRGLFQ